MKYIALLFIAVLLFSCSKDSTDPVSLNGERWTGPTITFSKAAGADPTLAENQDRITDNVWLTRGNDGGQIYNAVTETNADKNDSPNGTSWAIGTIDNIENLEFKSFRSTLEKPKDHIGTELVLYLQQDEIYISFKITSWQSGMQGGFSYERSTP